MYPLTGVDPVGSRVRRLAAAAVVACAVLMAAPAASARPPQPFDARFTDTVRLNEPITCIGFCGEGSVSGYGAATFTADFVASPTPLDNGCLAADVQITVALVDGTGTLDLAYAATICFPGRSTTTAGAQHSYGNPASSTGTFTTTSATGVFAGSAVGGTATYKTAGAHSELRLRSAT